MKVADIDMTNTSQQCPSGMSLIEGIIPSGRRLCLPLNNGFASDRFAVHGVEYSRVCGKVIGYQNRVPIAFSLHENINDCLFGVSLTHGFPRNHIWAFFGASDETLNDYTFKCPCTNTDIRMPRQPPGYLGNDYFCDTALSDHYSSVARAIHLDDPLWDGDGCGPSNACCSFPGRGVTPPWFIKDLPSSTTDDIDMRLCHFAVFGSTPIESVEIYVQ